MRIKINRINSLRRALYEIRLNGRKMRPYGRIPYVAFLGCLPIGLYRYHQDITYIILGFLTFFSAIVFVLLMVHYIRKIEGGGSMVKIVKDMEAEARFDLKDFTATMNFIISRLAFTMRRDFFAFSFLVLCLAGVAFIIQWLAAGALTFACIYFYYYSRRQLSLVPAKA